MKNRMMLLINPVAGRTALSSQLISVIDTFVKAGYEVNTVTTQNVEHLEQCAIDSRGKYDLLVCCGGDGTLNLTAGALCRIDRAERPLLGYIPCGTTNDFATSRGIPSDPTDAAKCIAEGNVHSIDVGFFGEKNYVYVAAFGVFADVSYATPRQMKKNIGHAAYVLEGIKSLGNIKDYHIKFKIGREEIEGDFVYGMLTNTTRIGGFELPIISDFTMDDGLIDITLIKKPKNVETSTQLINSLLTQRPDGEAVMQFRASKIEYEADKEIPWTLDGEFGGAYDKQVIELKHRILDMVY